MSNTTLNRLTNILAEYNGVSFQDVEPDGLLQGLDSLDLLEISLLLNQEFGVEVPIENWIDKITASEADDSLQSLSEYVDQSLS